MTAINTLYQGGLLDQETALKILERGELFDDTVDIEEVLAASETEQLQSMEHDLAMAEGQAKIAAANAPAKPAPPKG
jgi:hypothetical protein